MNNKHILLVIGIIIIVIGAYLLFVSTTAAPENITPTDDEQSIVYCDENGNRYATETDARAAGLTEAQFGATYCPEYVAAATGDYTGLAVSQAMDIADERGEQFRVVEIDGEPQPTTRDVQEGRINATVVGGLITTYTVESMNPPVTGLLPVPNDELIGMVLAAAETYAQTNDIDFRTGTIDGVGLALTADFRPGRITAEVEDGIVVGYTVE